MSSNNNLGSEIYKGAAQLGKTQALIGAVLGSIVSIGLIIIGIFILRNRRNLHRVYGTVDNDSVCSQQNENLLCTTRISYTLKDGTSLENIRISGNRKYMKNDKIVVYYNPSNPNNPIVNLIPSWAGWIFIAVSLFIILGGWLNVYLTQKYKFAAAASGLFIR